VLEQLSTILLFPSVVLCAWAYPRLNHWVYRRRTERDARWAAHAERLSSATAAGERATAGGTARRADGSPERA
jgi:hypothetical protein